MVKNYEDMSYEEAAAEKRDVFNQIAQLKDKARMLAGLMEAKQGDQKLQAIADKLSPEEQAALKDKL